MGERLAVIGRWIQLLWLIPAAFVVVWKDVGDEIRKERYERGEV